MGESPLFSIRSVSASEKARHFSFPHDRVPKRVHPKAADTKSEEESEDPRDDAQERKPRLGVKAYC